MTEINTREIAETLMLDAAREVQLDRIWDELDALPAAERDQAQSEIDSLIQLATVTIELPGQPWVHHYVSTFCLHELHDGDPAQHDQCRQTCKACDRSCECPNHTAGETRTAPPSWVDQARDIARELWNHGFVTPELEQRVATDPALFWLRGEEKPPGTWTPPEVSDGT